ncbi:unnamed protein product [Diatraea saccharalis]|uniref:Regulatory protein zeste n=1 Tax=Diatraea saccharalis TaxID=40085 RepID=A0A9N9R5Q5_9NEOP|nr:unnamed protein product [Diatraea saccharalis]
MSEVRLLTELVAKHRTIIENKKTDAVTNKEKEAAWNKIATLFNAATGLTARSTKSLKLSSVSNRRAEKKRSHRKLSLGPSSSTTPREPKAEYFFSPITSPIIIMKSSEQKMQNFTNDLENLRTSNTTDVKKSILEFLSKHKDTLNDWVNHTIAFAGFNAEVMRAYILRKSSLDRITPLCIIGLIRSNYIDRIKTTMKSKEFTKCFNEACSILKVKKSVTGDYEAITLSRMIAYFPDIVLNFLHIPDFTMAVEYSELQTIHPEYPKVARHQKTPGTSSQPTVHPITATNDIGLPTIDDADEWQPPAPKRNKIDSLAKLFIESDRNARQYARERDLAYEKLEKERIELHDYEILSSKSHGSESAVLPEESCVVQVLESSEPLVTASSSVPHSDLVRDSSEPLVPYTTRVQELDSVEPFVLPSFTAEEPVAGPSGMADFIMPAAPTFESEETPASTASSGSRVHLLRCGVCIGEHPTMGV